MGKRGKLIEKEKEYIDYLHSQIPSEANKEHFLSEVMWRFSQAEVYRKKYYRLQWYQALIGVIIIALGAFQEKLLETPIVICGWSLSFGILIAILGGLSSLTTFALSRYKYYDSWKRYRSCLEEVKSLTRIYVTKNKPFDAINQDINDKLYVVELDKLISSETTGWKALRDSET